MLNRFRCNSFRSLFASTRILQRHAPEYPPLRYILATMRTGLLVSSTAAALASALAISSTAAAPLEKRLMLALSLEASPTIPSLNLDGLLPTPTIPPIAGEIVSIITSVVDGVTSLIPTTIPSPTLPAAVQGLIPDVTMSVGITVATPTQPPVGDVMAQLAQGALNAVPTMLMQNLAQIQSEFSAALAAASTATPTPVVIVTTDEAGQAFTATSTPTLPALPTAGGVINPISILANALPQPSDLVADVTSVIGGVTSVLKVPALPQPTDLLPLLNSAQLPHLDIPGLMGDKQHLCIKDNNGNQIGLCPDGPLINDSEIIAL